VAGSQLGGNPVGLALRDADRLGQVHGGGRQVPGTLVRERSHVHVAVHEIHCPEALSMPQHVSDVLHEQEEQGLPHAEREQRRAQAPAQHLHVSEVHTRDALALEAHGLRARAPHLHARLHALQQIFAEEQGDHKHDDRDNVPVFEVELHAKCFVYFSFRTIGVYMRCVMVTD
jgi:hypothetical protein